MSQNFPIITIDGNPLPPDAITYELARLLKFYSQHMPEDQVRAQMPALRQRAIDQAIGTRLLFDNAARLDLRVTDDEVDKTIATMISRSGGREKFDELLAKQKLTEEELRQQIRRGQRVDKLVEQIVADTPDPTEADIRAHFDAHSDEYNRPERVLAQHILVKPADDTAEARSAARAKLDEIRQRVLNGASFSDEAAAHSECPSGKQGGSLGWFSRGMMVEAFDHAAFELPKGAMSEIIETQFGYHIIYKSDQEESRPADFDEARESIRDFLRHSRRGEVLAQHVAELRSKVKIEQTAASS